MPPAVQLLACVFAAAMAYVAYLGFRRRHFGVVGLIFWEVIWAGLVIVSLLPGIFQPLTRTLRVARLMDLVVVIGMLVLGAVTYWNYVTLQRLQRQLERLVREQALADLDSETRRYSEAAPSPPQS